MKEINILKVMTLVETGQLTRTEAAKKLELSERQLNRLQELCRVLLLTPCISLTTTGQTFYFEEFYIDL
jgi:hypothetical protein